jgi:hypothetical protein
MLVAPVCGRHPQRAFGPSCPLPSAPMFALNGKTSGVPEVLRAEALIPPYGNRGGGIGENRYLNWDGLEAMFLSVPPAIKV